MGEIEPCEDGITTTVKTLFSEYTLSDIIDDITSKKVTAVMNWLGENGKVPEKCLIIGSYLTGAKLANTLGKTTSVTVLDTYPHLKNLLNPDVSFTTCIDDLDRDGWDFIMDTTGLGGIHLHDLEKIACPPLFLSEDPCSDGSDGMILGENQRYTVVSGISAPRKGVLYTRGLQTKTSGTMTLMIEVLHHSISDANRMEGVLYSTASLDHFERILFKDLDYVAFMMSMTRPALIVSSLKMMNCNEIIDRNLSEIISDIIDFSGKRS